MAPSMPSGPLQLLLRLDSTKVSERVRVRVSVMSGVGVFVGGESEREREREGCPVPPALVGEGTSVVL